jgi:transcriptional regulator with XRE-family HTH domain
MNFISLSSPRLKEERERLKLTQADMAGKCGVSREIWGKYERGLAVPGGEVLFALAQVGADVQYIITGKRSGDALLNREASLLDNYRQSDDRGRRIIEQTASVMAESVEGKFESKAG